MINGLSLYIQMQVKNTEQYRKLKTLKKNDYELFINNDKWIKKIS